MCVCMYIALEIEGVIYSCKLLYMFAEFCPEPPKHVGQPVQFQDDESDEEACEVPEEQYLWHVGVTNQTNLRTAL